MRCLDCQKMALLCTSTSKSIVEDPKGRYYLSKFAEENPGRLFSGYWFAYKVCKKYAMEPNLSENQNEWNLLEEVILKVSPRWRSTHMKLEIDNRLFEYVKENLLMLAQYWLKSMDMVEGAFKLFLIGKYDDCFCKYFDFRSD